MGAGRGNDTMHAAIAILAAFGAALGLAYWLLVDFRALEGLWPAEPMALAAILIFGLSFGLLADRRRRAAIEAGGLTLGGVLLSVLVALRFGPLERFDPLEGSQSGISGQYWVLLAGLAAIATILLLARRRGSLWDAGLEALVKSGLTLIVVSLFWACFALSSLLLMLVGIELLQNLLREQAFLFPVSGGVAGGVLAAIHAREKITGTLCELLGYLLRALMIPLTALILVFFAGIIGNGFEGVFQRTSAAMVLLMVAFGTKVLVLASHGRAENSKIARIVGRLLSVLLVPLTVLALYAVMLRLGQYGITPGRLMAALVAGLAVLVAFALAAMAFARDWAALQARNLPRIAWIGLGLAALAFTPILNLERLSTDDQVARLLDGRTEPERFDTFALSRKFGKAGKAALASLAARSDIPEPDVVHARIAEPVRPGRFVNQVNAWPDIAVWPRDAELPPIESLGDVRRQYFLQEVERACGNADANCVARILSKGDLIIIAFPNRRGVEITWLTKGEDGAYRAQRNMLAVETAARDAYLLYARENGLEIEEVRLPGIRVGEQLAVPERWMFSLGWEWTER